MPSDTWGRPVGRPSGRISRFIYGVLFGTLRSLHRRAGASHQQRLRVAEAVSLHPVSRQGSQTYAQEYLRQGSHRSSRDRAAHLGLFGLEWHDDDCCHGHGRGSRQGHRRGDVRLRQRAGDRLPEGPQGLRRQERLHDQVHQGWIVGHRDQDPRRGWEPAGRGPLPAARRDVRPGQAGQGPRL